MGHQPNLCPNTIVGLKNMEIAEEVSNNLNNKLDNDDDQDMEILEDQLLRETDNADTTFVWGDLAEYKVVQPLTRKEKAIALQNMKLKEQQKVNIDINNINITNSQNSQITTKSPNQEEHIDTVNLNRTK